MAISYVNLVGAREAPDKTVRDLLQDNWNSENTSSITPTFQSATEEPDLLTRQDNTAVNTVAIMWFTDERIEDSDNEPNGDSIHHWKHLLRIDVWAETMTILLQFQDEINRILWQFAPDSSTRLNKSDATASEADYFEKTEITFERIEPEEGVDWKPSVSGILEIHFRKNKT